jgi:hypothetical protein
MNTTLASVSKTAASWEFRPVLVVRAVCTRPVRAWIARAHRHLEFVPVGMAHAPPSKRAAGRHPVQAIAQPAIMWEDYG